MSVFQSDLNIALSFQPVIVQRSGGEPDLQNLASSQASLLNN
jgi:hypothetical protein